MVLNRAVRWNVDEGLRGKLQYKRHDANVGLEITHGLLSFRALEAGKLIDGYAQSLRSQAQTVRALARAFRFAKDTGDLVASGNESLQHGFAKILLPDQCKFNHDSLPKC